MAIRLHNEKRSDNRTQIFSACCSMLLGSVFVVACGSGSDPIDLAENTAAISTDSTAEIPPDVLPIDVLPTNVSVDPSEQVAIDPEQADLFEDAQATIIGDETATDEPFVVGDGSLIPTIFPSATGVDPRFAQAGAAMVIELDESLILPADIDVNQGGDGTSNSAIFMCHELTQLFSSFFGDEDQAFSASVFVLMHELGHAFVEELSLPVLGIEESYVDGVAAVLLGESSLSEGSALAGWFFGSQPNTPFSDSHRANPQRLGDLVCWGIGADPTLLEKPIINSIFEQLVIGGRDCVGLEGVLVESQE